MKTYRFHLTKKENWGIEANNLKDALNIVIDEIHTQALNLDRAPVQILSVAIENGDGTARTIWLDD